MSAPDFLSTDGKVWSKNPNCLHYNIKTHSQEWHDFRMRGFGASEIGVVTRASDWAILPQLIEKKAGLREEDPLNEAMLGGLLAEDGILKRWKYYDGNGKNYVQNYVRKMIFREFTKFSGYMTNVKYPLLFTSTDAWAMPGSPNLVTAESMPIGFPVEAKQINGFHTDRWISGVPPQYIFQAHQEMMIFEVDYIELAILKNGNDFEVIPLEKAQAVCDTILEDSAYAWDLVLKVRELKDIKDNAPYDKKNEVQLEIDNLLPLPDNNPLHKLFYSDKFLKKKEAVEIPGDVYQWASERVRLTAAAKAIKKEIDLREHNIARQFTLDQSEYYDAGNDGKLRYYIRGNGKNHTLDFAGWKSKPKAEKLAAIEEKVDEVVKQILS